MVTFRESFEVFCFSVMESSFCFANVEFVTVPAASFIDDFGPLRSVQAIFVWKKGFDAACVLEYDLEIDERSRVEIVVYISTAADHFSQSRFQTSIVL